MCQTVGRTSVASRRQVNKSRRSHGKSTCTSLPSPPLTRTCSYIQDVFSHPSRYPALNTPTNLDLSTRHLKTAVTLEDSRALDEEDDSEGATLLLEALEDELSDLTPLEYTDEEDTHTEPIAQA